MIRCFYHSVDLDGQASGAIVKFKFPEAQLIPINYGEKIDYNQISKDDTIYMVDFSLQPFSEMVELATYVGMNNLIWIDHHKSSIKDADDCILVNLAGHNTTFNQLCPGKRQDGKAGCELTWDYLFPDDEMPAAVSFLGRYDVWDIQGCVLPFQFGMRLNNTDPNNQELWNMFLQPEDDDTTTSMVLETIKNGETILRYQKQENEKYAKSCAFELEFQGFKAIAINKSLTNSQLFESVWNKEKYDIMIAFGLKKDGIWTMSFYTDKPGIDCSILAKKFNGGGHKQASGCSFETLPIEFLRQIKKLKPIKYEPLPDPEDGEHMTIQDFTQATKDNFFTEDDGTGYYATETQMTNKVIVIQDTITRKLDDRFSHVVWFNK